LKIIDAIYGNINLPDFLDPLLVSPEFRRLSEVRLININSPSLSSLSETRRYSHTLGVIYLALLNPMLGFGEEERKSLLAAIIVHDAATPAFAHLFEYFLSDRFNWNHEAAIPSLLVGNMSVDSVSTQIYFSQTPKFKEICDKSRIDFELILAILKGEHPLSRLVFGSIDFDNLDNVARMNWMLGVRVETERIERLASNLGAQLGVGLILPKSIREDVDYWRKIRRHAYEILVYDAPTVSAQAVLSRAIKDSLENGTLGLQDWMYPDTELISALRKSTTSTKKMLDRDFIGILPNMCLLSKIDDMSHPFARLPREAAIDQIEVFLKKRGVGGRIYGYVFRDKGAFEKQVVAVDPHDGEEWTVGEQSNSILIYGFSTAPIRWNPKDLGKDFLTWAQNA
jgi:HD superfamily phosphohydrolase